jgi:hypothetical protein
MLSCLHPRVPKEDVDNISWMLDDQGKMKKKRKIKALLWKVRVLRELMSFPNFLTTQMPTHAPSLPKKMNRPS